jgi:hypothetical protein
MNRIVACVASAVVAGLVVGKAQAQPCAGDCDGNGVVAINELIVCVSVSLGSTPLTQCTACDPNGDTSVAINELIAAVNSSLGSCAPAPGTPSVGPQPTPTATPITTPIMASPITYVVNQTILSGGVTGTITTDGTTGLLTVANIVSWNLLLTGGGASFSLTDMDSEVLNYGTNGSFGPASVDVTATTHDLFFDYSGPDAGYFLFQSPPPYGGQHYWCNATHNQTFDCAVGASVVPVLFSDPTSQYDTARTGKQIIGTVAASAAVPEPGSLGRSGSRLLH